MASELSRLIDEELEKVENGAQSPPQRAALRIKTASPQKRPEDTQPPTWRERAWWTWQRMLVAAAVAVFVCSVLYLSLASAAGSSSQGYSAGKSDGGASLRPEGMFGSAGDSLPAATEPAGAQPQSAEAASQKTGAGQGPAAAQAAGEAGATPPPPHSHKTHKHKVNAPPKHHNEAGAAGAGAAPPTLPATPSPAAQAAAASSPATGVAAAEGVAPAPGPGLAPAAASAQAGAGVVPAAAPAAGLLPQLAPAPLPPTWSKQIGRKLLL